MKTLFNLGASPYLILKFFKDILRITFWFFQDNTLMVILERIYFFSKKSKFNFLIVILSTILITILLIALTFYLYHNCNLNLIDWINDIMDSKDSFERPRNSFIQYKHSAKDLFMNKSPARTPIPSYFIRNDPSWNSYELARYIKNMEEIDKFMWQFRWREFYRFSENPSEHWSNN